MKKIIRIFATFFLLWACSNQELSRLTVKTSQGEVIYYVETADTIEEMAKGLMYRKKMPLNSGMIFLFGKNHPQPIGMWMKNTLIPLDMLFLSEDYKIIAIVQNTQPLSLKIIQPTKEYVSAVVELNAGEVKKNGIKLGDQIIYP